MIYPKSKLQFVHVLTGALIAVSLFATNQSHATLNLEDMSLQDLLEVDLFEAASLVPIDQHKAPGTVYSFTALDIERYGVRRLDELLEFVPGMQTSQYRKRHKSVTARGVVNRYNSKTLLLVDGRPMRHSYYGHYGTWDNFPIELIEKVEIILGPASALYGANAFGGTISVTTKKFSTEQSSSASVELGNHSRRKFTNQFSNEYSELFVSYTRQDAPFADDRYTLLGERPALQDLGESLFSIVGKVKLTDEVTFNADYQNLSYPFLYILNDRSIQIDERPINLSLNFEKGDFDTGRIEAVAYYNRDDVNETEVRTLTGVQEIESQDANILGVKLSGFKQYGQHGLATGLEWRKDAADNMNVNGQALLTNPNITQDDVSLFVQDVWELSDSINLTLGARYDAFDLYGNEFSPRLAVVYTPSQSHTLKFLYGQGVRTPTFREAFKVLESNFIAPIPSSEHSKMTELVYNYRQQDFSFSASVYHNQFEAYITETLTPDGQDEFSVNSANNWRMQGMDIEAAYELERIYVRGTLSYLDIDEKGTDQEFPVADMTASINAGYEYSGEHRVALNVLYNAERPDFNENVVFASGVNSSIDNPDAFIDIGLQLSGPLGLRDIDYAFGVSNLLDETIYDSQVDFNNNIFNNARPEREFWLKLSKTF